VADEGKLPKFGKTQLAQLFGVSRNTVISRLRTVAPCGKDRQGHAVYTLPVAAAALLDIHKPAPDWEGEDGEIDPDRLPPDMAKDYWDGQLKKQKFYENEGFLWQSERVVDALTGIIKPLAFALRSLPDSVARRANLTPKQIEAVKEETDRTQKAMYAAVVEFANGLPPDS
jgi:hypothetical protein